MSLMDQLTQVVAAQMAPSAAQKTGLSEGRAAELAPMAMSILMNALKKNASSDQGAQSLAAALDRHDGGLLDNAKNLANDDVMADGQKILGHIFGNNLGAAEKQMASAAGGIDQTQIASILAMAAPAVLGALGKAKRDNNMSVNDIARLVSNEGNVAQKSASNELSGLMKLLDQNNDGDISDEAMGFGKKLLGGLFSKKK